MNKPFKTILTEWMFTKSITRNELIAHLQLNNYEDFKGLDAITLSRWLTGKTVPSAHKQLLICKSIEADLVDFVKKINAKNVKCPSRKTKLMSEFIKLLDYINPTLSYKKANSTTKIHVDIFNYNQHQETLGDFYKNIRPINKFTAELYELGNEISYPTIQLLNEHDEMIGHWVAIEPLEKVHNLPSFPLLQPKELDEGYLLNVSFYHDSKHFFYLISLALCYYLLAPKFKNKRIAYIFISGYSVYEVTKLVFDAEDVKYYPPQDKNSRLGIHLVKMDILKIIANPIVLPLIQKRLTCLEQCKHDCQLCNLKNYL